MALAGTRFTAQPQIVLEGPRRPGVASAGFNLTHYSSTPKSSTSVVGRVRTVRPRSLVIAEIVSMTHEHPMFPLPWRGAVGLGDHVQRQKLREHPRGTACRTADRTDSPAINHVDATAPSSPSRNDTGGLFQGRRLGRHPAGLRSHPVSRQATTRGEGR